MTASKRGEERERERERERENCERYIVGKRVVNKKKKKSVFFAQVVSLNVVISI